MDKEWVQVYPWNYWVYKNWDVRDLSTNSRTIEYNYDWKFDNNFTENEFSKKMLKNERPWRKAKNPPPPIEKSSDLPEPPEVRSEFWNKMGITPIVFEK